MGSALTRLVVFCLLIGPALAHAGQKAYGE
jgi:hypothetical protein